jgi:hypothetical protein
MIIRRADCEPGAGHDAVDGLVLVSSAVRLQKALRRAVNAVSDQMVETAMDFVVTLKGFGCFFGKFSEACEFIRQHWGSQELASEMGVRLVPANRYRLG